ncbi:MAG: sugar-transfer associated ATP-grasp domain-containing protein [Candidatus Krumholzibacteria bacterium]|nr:sugar-transfer associated ATP-grasp domain-containing protein [Candidatus Krumholzibacteria bacterium]
MEQFAKDLRRFLKRLGRITTPHFRQMIRFLLLPYCFFFLVNWKECRKPRLQVAKDLLYIFFVLRYFPDNYSPCRLYEKDRSEWDWFYGSSYNPYQRARLIREVTPPEYQVLFEDKEVLQQLCLGAGLRTPAFVGMVSTERPARRQLEQLLESSPATEFFIKPVTGAAGRDIAKATKGEQGIVFYGNGRLSGRDYCFPERHIVQEKVLQHPQLEAIYAGSLNTMRIVTLYTKSGDSIILATKIRFGRDGSYVDNWSRGGIGVGIDMETGTILPRGFDKLGRIYEQHPNTYVPFAGHAVPMWNEILDFSRRTQSSFPYFRLLGLDVALAPEGPLLIEVNAYPDLVGLEQGTGPLLRNHLIYEEFSQYDLFINRRQRALRAHLPS